MPFKPGDPRPENAGRKKGSPNKITKTLESFFDEQGLFLPEKILSEIQEIASPSERMKVWLELLQYIYPKRKALEMSGEITNPYAHMTLEELKELGKKKLEEK